MINIENYGWDPKTVGEINHKLMKPPFVRIGDYKIGEKGDIVILLDFRIVQPNQKSLKPKLLHSMEHLLLEGLRFYLKDKLINVGPMGCQTGFYITVVNIYKKDEILSVMEKVLNRILEKTEVPYRNVNDCGQAKFHDLTPAQNLAKKLLAKKDEWAVII